MFKTWGVLYNPTRVVLDRFRALKIEMGGVNFNHPAMLGLGADELNRQDVVTASLQQIDVSSAGYFDLARDATTRLIPLLQSTSDAQAVNAQRVIEAAGEPARLLQGYKADEIHYVLAARLHGTLTSAFPERADRPAIWLDPVRKPR